MSLAQKASVPIPPLDPPITILCHTAVWFYAAQEAQDRGLSPRKTTKAILGNIAIMPEGPQQAMKGLPRSGTWDFNKTPTTPIDGTVLLWEVSPTHSAIVTGKDRISGYNQANLWPDSGMGYSTRSPVNITKKYKVAQTILEDTIVSEAGRRNL